MTIIKEDKTNLKKLKGSEAGGDKNPDKKEPKKFGPKGPKNNNPGGAKTSPAGAKKTKTSPAKIVF
jgi:hypothetical protein